MYWTNIYKKQQLILCITNEFLVLPQLSQKEQWPMGTREAQKQGGIKPEDVWLHQHLYQAFWKLYENQLYNTKPVLATILHPTNKIK